MTEYHPELARARVIPRFKQRDWSVALLVAWAGTAAILFSATYLYRWLGQRVLTDLLRTY